MRITFSTPVTPTRERPTGTDGVRACTSGAAAVDVFTCAEAMASEA